MDLVMQPEYDHVVLLNEGELLAVDRVIGEKSRVVEVVIEGGLMSDHEIGATTGSIAQNIHGVKESHSNSGYGSGWIAGLCGIDSVRRKRGRVVLLDAMDRLGRSKSLRSCSEREDRAGENGDTSLAQGEWLQSLFLPSEHSAIVAVDDSPVDRALPATGPCSDRDAERDISRQTTLS